MKKYFKVNQMALLALVLSSSVLVSCKKDFLDQTPNNAITDENYYRTEADAVKAVFGSSE